MNEKSLFIKLSPLTLLQRVLLRILYTKFCLIFLKSMLMLFCFYKNFLLLKSIFFLYNKITVKYEINVWLYFIKQFLDYLYQSTRELNCERKITAIII